ncbi:hypothetical protein QQ020_21290 [Fulvivirgaceae bacterium BMA12]|uniref:Uncharacterized protein n=1 Tax=Agaribacillus aureus TaxID=3051825 RepID=A0ABT8LAC7_9BACT|nr:hypothetical protein [Fulvivirgaceae bacterium BMA12]
MEPEKIKPEVHPKLAHLTKERREEFYNRFYNEKNSVLIDEFKIKGNANLHKLFEPKIIDEICEYCNVCLWEYYPSKSTQKIGGEKKCPRCDHTIYPNNEYSWRSYRCFCSNCTRVRFEKEERERKELEIKMLAEHEKLKEMLKNENEKPINLTELDFNEKVYLLSFLKGEQASSSEISRFSFYRPFMNLAPTTSLKEDIIKVLLKCKALKISQNANLDSYNNYIENNNIEDLLVSKSLELNINEANDLYQNCVEYLQNELKSDFLKGVIIWRRVALHECVEYLNDELLTIGLPVREGTTTVELFEELLNIYSVSQINKITERIIERAAKDKLSGSSSNTRIANNVVGGIRSYANKGINEGWCSSFVGLPEERRKPQSLLSKLVFNDVLSIGSKGYINAPSLGIFTVENGFNQNIIPPPVQ